MSERRRRRGDVIKQSNIHTAKRQQNTMPVLCVLYALRKIQATNKFEAVHTNKQNGWRCPKCIAWKFYLTTHKREERERRISEWNSIEWHLYTNALILLAVFEEYSQMLLRYRKDKYNKQNIILLFKTIISIESKIHSNFLDIKFKAKSEHWKRIFWKIKFLSVDIWCELFHKRTKPKRMQSDSDI